MLITKGISYPVGGVQFDDSNQRIEIKNASGNSIYLRNYLPYDKYQSYQIEDYTIFILQNKHALENNIFQVYDQKEKERIGWLFPSTAITSNNHDYKSNEHFLRYACVAIRKIFMDLTVSIEVSISLQDLLEVDISDIFDEDINILVLSNKKLDSTLGSEYFLHLIYYGYIPQSLIKSTFRATIGKNNFTTLQNVKRLNLKTNSHNPEFTENLNRLIKEILDSSYNEILRFYFLYQIIEFLIDLIFNQEIKKCIQEIQDSSSDYRKIRENFSEISKEKKRITNLLTHYTSNKLDAFLIGSSQQFLESYNSLMNGPAATGVNSKPHADLIYKVRNTIFHSFIKIDNLDGLESFNNIFESLILEVLLHFKI